MDIAQHTIDAVCVCVCVCAVPRSLCLVMCCWMQPADFLPSFVPLWLYMLSCNRSTQAARLHSPLAAGYVDRAVTACRHDEPTGAKLQPAIGVGLTWAQFAINS